MFTCVTSCVGSTDVSSVDHFVYQALPCYRIMFLISFSICYDIFFFVLLYWLRFLMFILVLILYFSLYNVGQELDQLWLLCVCWECFHFIIWLLCLSCYTMLLCHAGCICFHLLWHFCVFINNHFYLSLNNSSIQCSDI